MNRANLIAIALVAASATIIIWLGLLVWTGMTP